MPQIQWIYGMYVPAHQNQADDFFKPKETSWKKGVCHYSMDSNFPC